MENKATFFNRLESRLAPSGVLKVRSAYYLAKFGHRFQVRKEKNDAGEPLRYFEHLRRVAIILMDEAHVWDPDLICTALLHDSLEDTEDLDAGILEHLFGPEVARRVRLLSKVPKDGYLDRLRDADDHTLLLKACDRLDNLRSLEQADAEFRQKQITETAVKYLPLWWDRPTIVANPVYQKILDCL